MSMKATYIIVKLNKGIAERTDLVWTGQWDDEIPQHIKDAAVRLKDDNPYDTIYILKAIGKVTEIQPIPKYKVTNI